VADSLALEVAPAEAGLTAMAVLADALPDVRTADLRRLFKLDGVTRAGRPCGEGQTLAAGDRLEAELTGLPRIAPAPLPGFEVLARVGDVLACDKPAGAISEDTPLRAAVLHALEQRGEPRARPRVAHRLDRYTSGILLVALSRAALQRLTAAFEARAVEKEYQALVAGVPRQDAGRVDAPLRVVGRGKRPVVIDPAQGKPAATRWEVAERFGRHTLLRAWPETGRMHQVRVHLASEGWPIVCDAIYGRKDPLLLSQLKRGKYQPRRGQEEKPLLDRLALHAARLALESEGLAVESPLATDLELALKRLRKYDAP
jgi:RluA family pseudouridine synthase